MDRIKYSVRPRRLKGFTLVEMIIVIAIIGILSSIIVPNTVSYIRDSKIEKANTTAREVYTGIQNYLTDYQIKCKPLAQTATETSNDTVFPVKVTGSRKFIMYVDSYSYNKTGSMSYGFLRYKTGSVGINSANINKAPDVVRGISKYFGVSLDDPETLGAWAALIDIDTYTVERVYIIGNGADSYSKLQTFMGSDPMVFKEVFGGNVTSQEYDARVNNRYVGQYPVG